MEDPGSKNRLETLLVLFFALPIMAVAALVAVFRALAPVLPLLLLFALVGVSLWLWRAFKTSPHTVKDEHRNSLQELIAKAEEQQRALPRHLDAIVFASELTRSALLIPSPLQGILLASAQRIYEEEFLRPLPGSPGVPIEGERIYDDDFDRRTLKKGEEPPYRIRTDRHGRPTTVELELFERDLERYVASTTNPTTTTTYFLTVYVEFLTKLFRDVPLSENAVSPFTVPLIEMMPRGTERVGSALLALVNADVSGWHHFSSVRACYIKNRTKISDRVLSQRDRTAGKRIDIPEFDGTPREATNQYFSGSPLAAVFETPIPFAIPTAKRYEGQWIVARPSAGKTNALECLIHEDLTAVAEGKASLVVMDSQGIADDTLLGRLASLKYFQPGGPLEGKLIYLEPDLEYPLALNVFDLRLADMGTLTAQQHEDLVTSAVQVVEFLFTGILSGELSDNMTMLYRYLVPAMLAIPNADMGTFIELLDTDGGKERTVPAGFAKHQHHFHSLEYEIRSFLETDFLTDGELVRTKAAVRRRLRAAMADTMFRRMFMQPRNKLNLFKELQSAKVILVNTYPAKGYVEPFGRLILALLMQATRQRLEIDRSDRMPTFVYIDECQDYIAHEERIARYIDKCRKQNVGLVFAHQRLANIESPRVLNALSGLSIKLAGVSDADAAELAGLVGSEPEHIRGLERGTFATYVSGITNKSIDLKFPPSPLAKAARLSRDRFDVLRQQMRIRYGAPYRTDHSERPAVEEAPLPTTSDDYDPLAKT